MRKKLKMKASGGKMSEPVKAYHILTGMCLASLVITMVKCFTWIITLTPDPNLVHYFQTTVFCFAAWKYFERKDY